MRATILLCDSAQIADDKIYVLGWGWSLTGPDPTPHALAVRFEVSWNEMDQSHHWELFLVDEDGRPVMVQGPDGTSQAIEVRGDFQVRRPPELPPGSSFGVPAAFQLPPLPLKPASRFTWQLIVDGESKEDWRVSFSTRPPREAPAEET